MRVTHRNAWTDTYDPDPYLRAFLEQMQRPMTAGETADIRLCMAEKAGANTVSKCLKAFTSAEECQECTRCPDCCDCKEVR